MFIEANICRKFVFPKAQAATWGDDPHFTAEQWSFTTLGDLTHRDITASSLLAAVQLLEIGC
jgi:hypothetical protein